MKKASRLSAWKTAPLKSSAGNIITNRNEQMQRWEHLYSRENVVTEAAINSTPSLPVMEELEIPPTEEGTEPGRESIPAELLQCVKPTLVRHIHEHLCQCCEEGSVSYDTYGINIVFLLKNNGDRSDCNSYRGISLLSIVGRAFAWFTLKRLQRLAERVASEHRGLVLI